MFFWLSSIFSKSIFWKIKNISCEISGKIENQILWDFDQFCKICWGKIPKTFIKIGEFWTKFANHRWKFENKTTKMRKCLTKFSWIFEFGAVQKKNLLLFWLLVACFWPGLLLWKSGFSWFSDWIPKLQKCINLVDLVKSFQTSI